jgi:hypothetical protein
MARERSTAAKCVLLALLGIGCGTEPSADSVVRSTDLEVVAEPDHAPAGGNDAPPRYSVLLHGSNGARLSVESRVLAHVAYGGGIALIDPERRLIAVSGDGVRRVLAEEAGAPPARGSSGELLYVAQRNLNAEVHALEPGGTDRVIATGLAGAGMLAPQADGTIFFVGARNGGVAGAGLWRISGDSSRCLTNCDLETGKPWGDLFVPPPGEAAAIEVVGERVEWDAHDGKRYSASLRGER